MKQKLVVLSLLAAGVALGAMGARGMLDPTPISHAHAASMTTSAATASQSVPAIALPDFTGIVKKNGRAVVNISVTEKTKNASVGPQIQGLDPNNPFYQFFRQFGMPVPQQQVPERGLGSGFIVRPDGIILTNAHVVSGASNITVKLTDKREFKAKVIGIDKPSDIAVLKINAEDLPTVKLDGANDVKVGQWVVAIGSPYGFDNSVTAGIVSAKSRNLPHGSYVPFIQTDVAVNPGNSGGPLFNMKGEVVGINSQIYTNSGGYQGLSFAIPIDVALNVENQILAHGSVTRGHLGVTIQDVNQGLADSFGLKNPTGALVSSVEKNSPAAKAGLEPGDVILSYDNKKISGSSDLPVLVANTAPGTTAKLEVLRKGEHKQMDITVGKLQNTKVASAGTSGQDHGRLGVVVRSLTPEEMQQAGVTNGVIVEDVNGPAANAGIEAGDVILSVNDKPVKSPADLKSDVENSGKHVALLVQRNDVKTYVAVDLA